jgi:hypothetical protein
LRNLRNVYFVHYLPLADNDENDKLFKRIKGELSSEHRDSQFKTSE